VRRVSADAAAGSNRIAMMPEFGCHLIGESLPRLTIFASQLVEQSHGRPLGPFASV